MVVSFRLRFRETIRCTASTVHVPPFHTACITSFSRSVRGGRTRAWDIVRDVMVQHVPVSKIFVKDFVETWDEGGKRTEWIDLCRRRTEGPWSWLKSAHHPDAPFGISLSLTICETPLYYSHLNRPRKIRTRSRRGWCGRYLRTLSRHPENGPVGDQGNLPEADLNEAALRQTLSRAWCQR
jgi:hypothetical protein